MNILIISVTLVVVAVPEGGSPAHTNVPELTLLTPNRLTSCGHSSLGLCDETDD